MEKYRPFEINGFIIAVATFILSFILFFYNSVEFSYSLMVAGIAAALTWASYVLVRWLILALRN